MTKITLFNTPYKSIAEAAKNLHINKSTLSTILGRNKENPERKILEHLFPELRAIKRNDGVHSKEFEFLWKHGIMYFFRIGNTFYSAF